MRLREGQGLHILPTQGCIQARALSPVRASSMDPRSFWNLGVRALCQLVLLRSLVHPVSDRHLYSWRKAAGLLRCSHTAAQVWHAQAIDVMVAAINRPVVTGLLEGQGMYTLL